MDSTLGSLERSQSPTGPENEDRHGDDPIESMLARLRSADPAEAVEPSEDLADLLGRALDEEQV